MQSRNAPPDLTCQTLAICSVCNGDAWRKQTGGNITGLATNPA